MREGLVALVLVLGLGGSLARAEDDNALRPGYMASDGTPESRSEGDLRVSVPHVVQKPPRGYFPLEVTLHNTGTTPRAVRLSVRSMGRASRSDAVVVRRVEVDAHQRLSAWLFVPVNVSSGQVHIDSPGLTLAPLSFSSAGSATQSVLVLGSEKAFQEGTLLAQEREQPLLYVRFMSPADAPRELAAYVGYPEIVLASDIAGMPADVWSALEAYAATGGLLTILLPPRDVAERLPLLGRNTESSKAPDSRAYGFGRVRLCEGSGTCTSALLAGVTARMDSLSHPLGEVHPAPPPHRWSREALGSGLNPLLPGVQAPVGILLGLVTLFVLVVGPGGLMLARRKGPLVLLIAVPGVSFVACLAIVFWSVLVEGFDLHAARYSLTRLDHERARMVTLGVGGYYANLKPKSFAVPTLAALLSSDADWEGNVLEADWSRGMTVSGGFLSARTYQEWGEVAVTPSRARLFAKPGARGLVIHNALGAPLVEGRVHFGDDWWIIPPLADGAEGEAVRMEQGAVLAATWEMGFSKDVEQRIYEALKPMLREPLPQGGFLVKLEGPGGTFSRELPVRLHEGLHLVRGQVARP
ncbi:MAG: hypothetical protein ABW123_19935 [Cystobacter sp.]